MRQLFIAFLLLGSLLATQGCEESVDAIVGTEIPYTIWGFMNAGADTQTVRVFPIEDDLIPNSSIPLDAKVFSTDLTTGERREWTYEKVRFDSLISGHIFWSPFRAEYQHRYRLEVVRSDGNMSSAEATVPSEVQFDIGINDGSTKIPVTITGDIPNLVGLRVTYNALNVPPRQAFPVGTIIQPAVSFPVSIIYDNALIEQENQWSIEIDMARDFIAVNQIYGANCLITPTTGSAPDIWLRTIEFTALAADSSWAPPGGIFDPNVLAVPGTFSNVENGYGFFGAGQGIRYEWTPNQSALLTAGFNFIPKCPGLFPTDIPECREPPEPCIGDNLADVWRIWLR